MSDQSTLIKFIWDTTFTDEGGVQFLCGTARDSVTGTIVSVKVRKATIDTMAADYTRMEWASVRGATDDDDDDDDEAPDEDVH